jgi:hypothetical protein
MLVLPVEQIEYGTRIVSYTSELNRWPEERTRLGG